MAGPGEVVVAEGDIVSALEVGEVAEAEVDHLLGQGQVRKNTLKHHREHVSTGDLSVRFH